MCTASIFQHAAIWQHSGCGQILLLVLSFAMLFPCFATCMGDTHTIVQVVLLNILFCTMQSKLNLWYFAGSCSCVSRHDHDTCMLRSVAVMAKAIVSAVCVYLCRLVNSMLFCDFTAAVFSWDDSSTGDRDADSRHLSNRLPGLPFPIPGPAQPRERCQCAAGPGNLYWTHEA